MRRSVAALVGALAVGLISLGGTSAAVADGEGRVTRYEVELIVRPDGVLEVEEWISYTFDNAGHGIERFIPTRSHYDDTYDRVIEIDDVRINSSSYAPIDLVQRQEDGYLKLRIGDPDLLVSGPQSYLIRYTVTGALDTLAGHDELSWDAIGTQWNTSITDATVTIKAPAIDDVACFYGKAGSDRSCGSGESGEGVDRPVTTTFGPVDLDANEGITVVVEMPKGAVEVPPPVLVERWSIARAFSVTPLTVGLAVLVLVLGSAAVAVLVRRGRDEHAARRMAGGHEASAAEATSMLVDWRALDEMRPGLVGTLVDERANLVDVTATIVDLAVRGHLRIEIRFGERDWRLVRLDASGDALLPYEDLLLTTLFRSGPSVRLSELRGSVDFHDELRGLRWRLYDEVVQRGWYRTRPDRTRWIWYGIGATAVAVTAGICVALAAFTSYGLVGAALVAPALAVLAGARVMPVRTAAGTAALQQVLALRRYIETAQAEQLRFEDSQGMFSKLMPYAMVFGQVEHWASAFRPLVMASRTEAASPGWHDAFEGWDFHTLGSAVKSFANAARSALRSMSDGDSDWSGGGSDWSGGGGDSGGTGSGGGGGGGGGW